MLIHIAIICAILFWRILNLIKKQQADIDAICKRLSKIERNAVKVTFDGETE